MSLQLSPFLNVPLSFSASLFNLWNKNYPFVKQLQSVGPFALFWLWLWSLFFNFHVKEKINTKTLTT